MAPGILLDRCMGVLRVARSTSFVVPIDRQSRGSKKRLGVWTYKTCVFKRGFECRNQMHCFRTFASSSQAAGGLLLCFRLWCTVHAERPRYNTPHFRARPGSVARVLGVQSCASKAIETKMSVFFLFSLCRCICCSTTALKALYIEAATVQRQARFKFPPVW